MKDNGLPHLIVEIKGHRIESDFKAEVETWVNQSSREFQARIETVQNNVRSNEWVVKERFDGQGVGGLNMAACYSCTLLPETACEEFNSFLYRAILIDDRFGFFRG